MKKAKSNSKPLTFLNLNAAEQQAQMKRRLEHNLEIYLNPGKHLSPSGGSFLRLSAREEDELREYGLLPKIQKQSHVGAATPPHH